MQVKVKNTILEVEKDNLYIKKNNKLWKSQKDFSSYIALNNGRNILFESAKQIESVLYESEVAKGILTRYRDLKGVNFAFDTLIWIEKSSEEVYFEWIPVNDNGFDVKQIVWPAPFVNENGYTLLPYYEGLKILTTEKTKWKEILPLYTKEGSMSFIAQVDENRNGYVLMSETPWDTCYLVDHEDYTKVHFTHLPNLGKMHYRRIVRAIFLEDCDEDKICDVYKKDRMEKGLFKNSLPYLEANEISLKVDAKDYAQNADGSFSKEICATKLLPYVKKDVENMEEKIDVSAFAYALVECNNPSHRISKKECMEKRKEVLQYLLYKNKKLTSKYKVEWIVSYSHFMNMEYEVKCGEKMNLFEKIYSK